MRLLFTDLVFVAGERMLDWLKSPKLLERAEAPAKQMRYFRLFSQRGSFDELSASATRAGFKVMREDAFDKEASFRWAAEADRPDFTFHLSFANPTAASVTAESYGEISGLVMTSISSLPKIGIEAKTSLENHELGRNAHQFRK